MPRESKQINVVKIGGSLLDYEPVREKIQLWSAQRPLKKMVFVVGGGQLADAVREWSQRFSLDSKSAHWNCIEMMQINALTVASWFPSWSVVDEFSQLAKMARSSRVVFRPKFWLRGCNNSMPESWDVTSDSIAARVAVDLDAEELVLLKSTDPPPSPTVRSLVTDGLVDGYFPQAVNDRTVRLVNLRRSDMREVVTNQRAAKSRLNPWFSL